MDGAADAAKLARNLVFLGFFTEYSLRARVDEYKKGIQILGALEHRLSLLRDEAMQSKDFTAVDHLKARLTAAQVNVQMTKTAVHLRPEMDFDPAKLEGLL